MSVRVWRVDRDRVLTRLGAWARSLGDRDDNVQAVLLFGSYARGDATAMSDADVLIILRRSGAAFRERIAAYKPVGVGVSVDVFPYTVAEAQASAVEGWGVVRAALREGYVLASRGDAIELLRRAERSAAAR